MPCITLPYVLLSICRHLMEYIHCLHALLPHVCQQVCQFEPPSPSPTLLFLRLHHSSCHPKNHAKVYLLGGEENHRHSLTWLSKDR
jgi:hypothetical protein